MTLSENVRSPQLQEAGDLGERAIPCLSLVRWEKDGFSAVPESSKPGETQGRTGAGFLPQKLRRRYSICLLIFKASPHISAPFGLTNLHPS